MSVGKRVRILGGKCNGKEGIIKRIKGKLVEVEVYGGRKCFFHQNQLKPLRN